MSDSNLVRWYNRAFILDHLSLKKRKKSRGKEMFNGHFFLNYIINVKWRLKCIQTLTKFEVYQNINTALNTQIWSGGFISQDRFCDNIPKSL
nr:hypothetical protein [Bacilli bacterium]